MQEDAKPTDNRL